MHKTNRARLAGLVGAVALPLLCLASIDARAGNL